MTETTREYIHRYARPMGAGFTLVGFIATTLILPGSYARAVTAVLFVAFAVFFVWARTALPPKSSATPAPGPTIREHLKRTRALLQRIMIPIAVAWGVGVTFYATGLSKFQQQALAVGGGIMLLLIGWFFVRNPLRCPRCGLSFNDPWP